MPPKAVDKNELPSKENEQYKQLGKLCDNKMHKKAVKVADGILKKFPQHANTIAMKALNLHCMDKPDEAWPLAKKALTLSLNKDVAKKHSVAWHIMALMHKRERNYKESSKCFSKALEQDSRSDEPDANRQQKFMKDLQLMQYLARDLDGLADTSRRLTQAQPSVGQHWASLALAIYLSGHARLAADILLVFIGAMNESDPEANKKGTPESSEMQMFLTKLLAESDGPKVALEHIQKNEKLILDKLGFREARAKLLLDCNNVSEALLEIRALIARNADDRNYYQLLRRALNVPVDATTSLQRDVTTSVSELGSTVAMRVERNKLLLPVALDVATRKIWREELERIISEQPKAILPQRLLLRAFASPFAGNVAADVEAAERASLAARVDALMRSLLRKGVPAAFTTLCDAIGRAPSSLALIAQLADSYIAALREKTRRLPAPLTAPSVSSSVVEPSDSESPATLFWTLLLRAHCAIAQDELARALEFLAQAQQHTPTSIDVFLLRGKVYKRAGDFAKAFEAVDAARQLDLADRYLNNKAAKFALRANMCDRALELLSMFTKRNEDAAQYLHEMQATWFELESGDAALARGDNSLAIYHYMWIDMHHDEIANDQVDFFGYCQRKNTLRSYLDFIALQDRVRQTIGWRRAAAGCVLAYCAIGAERAAIAAEEAALSADERRKRAKLAQQEQKKKSAPSDPNAALAQIGQSSTTVKKQKDVSTVQLENAPPPVDTIAATTTPLIEASKWALRLLREGGARLEAHVLGLRAHTLAGRFVLAMREARCALQLAPNDVVIERDVALLLDALDRGASTLAPVVFKALTAARASLPGGGDLKTRLASMSPSTRAESELALAVAHNERGAAGVVAAVAALVEAVPQSSRVQCERWLTAARQANAPATSVDALLQAAAAKHPLASKFRQ